MGNEISTMASMILWRSKDSSSDVRRIVFEELRRAKMGCSMAWPDCNCQRDPHYRNTWKNVIRVRSPVRNMETCSTATVKLEGREVLTSSYIRDRSGL
jgi:hypothetical protein